MFSVFFWILVMGISVALLVLSAAARGLDPTYGYVHLALAAGSAAILALFLIREIRAVIEQGGSRNIVGAAKVRAMGTLWIWGAIALFSTYGTGVLRWSSWWKSTLPFVVIGIVCMFISILLKRNGEKGRADEGLLRVLSALAKVQIAVMMVSLVWMLATNRMAHNADPANASWAAYNIFFFGAAVLGLLSMYVVSPSAQAKPEGVAKGQGRQVTIKSAR